MKGLSSLLIVLFFCLACKKEVEPKSTLELLTGSTSKTWKVREGKARQGEVSVNLLDSQNPCITDNVILLFQDFNYEFREGATKCSASDPDLILKASWQLNEAEGTMSIDRFRFLDFTIESPIFELRDIKEDSFSGTTPIQISGQNLELDITFELVP